MTVVLRATSAAEAPRVQQFLADVFNIPETALFLDPAHVYWKYYRPRADWPESRSYVYEHDGRIVAHASAWPFELRTMDDTITGVHPIDWAASNEVPGVGALLLREVRKLRVISCCIGGTDIAQSVISKTGFKPAGVMHSFVRPLRPWKQFLTHNRRDWKLPARFVRNALWVAKTSVDVPAGWSAEPIDAASLPDAVLPSPSTDMAVCGRTKDFFAYLNACPIARFQLLLIRRDGSPVGYALLSFVPGIARIADAWSIDQTVDSWSAIYALACRAALEDGSAAELLVACSLKPAVDALVRSGFRPDLTLPIMLFDPKKRLAGIRDIHLQLADNDFSFLHDGFPDYDT